MEPKIFNNIYFLTLKALSSIAQMKKEQDMFQKSSFTTLSRRTKRAERGQWRISLLTGASAFLKYGLDFFHLKITTKFHGS